MTEGRITVLIENTAGGRGTLAEHGLSFWIEIGSRRILFDTGQSDILLHNAQVLGIDLSTVDAVVLGYEPKEKDDSQAIEALKEHSRQHPREGSRKAGQALRRAGTPVNHKKVERLWHEHDLTVPVKRRRGGRVNPDMVYYRNDLSMGAMRRTCRRTCRVVTANTGGLRCPCRTGEVGLPCRSCSWRGAPSPESRNCVRKFGGGGNTP